MNIHVACANAWEPLSASPASPFVVFLSAIKFIADYAGITWAGGLIDTEVATDQRSNTLLAGLIRNKESQQPNSHAAHAVSLRAFHAAAPRRLR